MSTETVRTFLAVEASPEVHGRLVELKRQLAESGAAVRWVRDEGLHATVKFLDRVPESTLPGLRGALTDAVAGAPRMIATVRELGAFPTWTRPRVVWIGIDCPPLAQLATAVDDALAPLGFEREVRPFRAHITLGRVTGPGGRARLRAAVHTHAADDLGTCELIELIAYRSDLRRDGAVYTKLWTIPFGG
jgi:2'-5' RNA ligase